METRPKRRLKPRHREILKALVDIGGYATTQDIAKKAGMNVNGVSQSLGAINSIDPYYLDVDLTIEGVKYNHLNWYVEDGKQFWELMKEEK